MRQTEEFFDQNHQHVQRKESVLYELIVQTTRRQCCYSVGKLHALLRLLLSSRCLEQTFSLNRLLIFLSCSISTLIMVIVSKPQLLWFPRWSNLIVAGNSYLALGHCVNRIGGVYQWKQAKWLIWHWHLIVILSISYHTHTQAFQNDCTFFKCFSFFIFLCRKR